MAVESQKDIISPNQRNDMTIRGNDDSLNDSSRLGLIGESGNSKLDAHLIDGDEISLFKRSNTKGKGQRPITHNLDQIMNPGENISPKDLFG